MWIRVTLCLLAWTGAHARHPDGWHWITVDSSEVQSPKVDSLARRLGFVRTESWMMSHENTLYYQEKRFMPLFFRFTSARPGYSLNSGAWDSTWAVGFQAGGRFEAFLAAAYLQEIRPEFRQTFPAFREYREIDASSFNTRMWLSAGYAWQRAVEDNAMASRWSRLWVPFGYTVDALGAVTLAIAAAPNVRPEDRLGAAAFALGFTAFERLLMLPLGRQLIRQHNAVVRSGYRIPDPEAGVRIPGAAPR